MGVSDCVVDVIGENVDCVVCGGELIDCLLVVCYIGDLWFGVYVLFVYFVCVGMLLYLVEFDDMYYCVVGFLWVCIGKMLLFVMVCDGE